MENVRASKASKVAAVFMVAWSFVGITFIATAEQASARTIIVGGKERWHFGFNYTDWALKAAPFHVNDTLVFKYVRPNATIFHNVLKLPNRRAYEACDFKRAKLLADVNGGQGSGFAYVLNQTKPIYFGCGIHDGRHCNLGLMKFYVKPVGNSTSA